MSQPYNSTPVTSPRPPRKSADFIAASIAYGLFAGFCAAFAPLAWEIMKCL